jgi:hypothetical protein
MGRNSYFASLKEEGEEDLVEALSDIDGDVVDTILHGSLTECGEQCRHLAAVIGSDLFWLQPQLLAALEVDKEMGTGIKIEVHFVSHVIGMENDDFVLVMAEVPQSVEEGFLGF